MIFPAVVPPTFEPLTLSEGKLRANVVWADGDPRDVLLQGFIAAARSTVERRTQIPLLTQTCDLVLDGRCWWGALALLRYAPLQSVVTITTIDPSGLSTVLDPAQYVVDTAGGRIVLAAGGAWPTDRMVIRAVVGWPSAAALLAAAPSLVHAVGLLTAHYATLGRDLASTEAATDVPMGFEDAISDYLPVVVA